MTTRPRVRWLAAAAIAAAACLAAAPAAAQDGSPAAPPPGAGRRPDAVRERMRALFAARLRSDVGLDDAQVSAVLPKIETLERDRARIQRERVRVVRELRRGLASGMDDAGLAKRLEALDGFGRELERATESALADIDSTLTVPQRVRLRFLMVRFRAEMLGRIRDLRGGAPGAVPGAGPPGIPE